MLVPPAMGRHLATQIPNCHATFFSGAGHLLIDHMPEIIKAFTRSATSSDSSASAPRRGNVSPDPSRFETASSKEIY